MNVTLLGTKFGQSNEGGGSTGEGEGVGLERKGKTLFGGGGGGGGGGGMVLVGNGKVTLFYPPPPPPRLPSPAQSLSLKP